MEAISDRLAASKAEFYGDLRVRGAASGRDWAQRLADYRQLRLLKASGIQDGYFDSTDALCYALGKVLFGEEGWDEDGRDEVWPNMDVECEEEDFLRGFIEGSLEVLEAADSK